MTREGITVYCSVPTVFRHLSAEIDGAKEFRKVRIVRLIGEPVYNRDVSIFRKHFSPDCILVNRLGSTETGTILLYFVGNETEINGINVPLGYPVKGNDVLLVDEDGREVDSNHIGEIVVRSQYLSPGYWRRPDLTNIAFLSEPDEPQGRSYRTGDLGRLLDDGSVDSWDAPVGRDLLPDGKNSKSQLGEHKWTLEGQHSQGPIG